MAEKKRKRIGKAQAREELSRKRDPRGFFVLADDLALEQASQELVEDFEDSISKTASKL